jgi:hypothetical protein
MANTALKARYAVVPATDVQDAGFVFSDASNATKFADLMRRHAQNAWRYLEQKEKGATTPNGLPLDIIAQPVNDKGEPAGQAFVLSQLRDKIAVVADKPGAPAGAESTDKGK